MAGEGLPAQYLDGLSLSGDPDRDREVAVAAWRRAEARVYPTVMVSADLYSQYVEVVRAVIDQLGEVRTEEDLVRTWHEQRNIGAEAVRRLAPSMASLMDAGAIRDAAFCQRHRDTTREQGKQIARDRLERAQREQAEWVVLFEDVTPFGSQRLEMHVRTGRALHTSSQVEADGSGAVHELEVVQLDPADGTWLLDKPPLMPNQRFRDHEEWSARTRQARETFARKD